RDFALAGILCAAVSGNPALSEVTPAATVLVIDLENMVQYNSDLFDASKFATDPNITTLVTTPRNFAIYMKVGDIVAVTDKPAKVTFVVRGQLVFVSPTPSPGQAVADITRNAVADYLLEIQQADGAPVGCIYGLGLSGGGGPVGAPSELQVSNLAVAGGTGA